MAFRGLWLLSIWSFLWSLSEQAAFQFVVPPAQSSTVPNPLYQVGSILDIQWVSSETDFLAIRMAQVLSDPSIDNYVYVFENVSGLSSYPWQITLGTMNLTVSDEFFLDIFIQGQTSPSAWSHNFNLTNNAVTSSTTTAPSSTTTAPSQTTTTSIPATTTSTSATTNPAAPVITSGSGLSAGAQAGIGVGVAVAVIGGVAAGLFIARYLRETNKANTLPENQPMNTDYHYYSGTQATDKGPGYVPPPSEPPSELPVSEQGAYELPNSRQ